MNNGLDPAFVCLLLHIGFLQLNVESMLIYARWVLHVVRLFQGAFFLFSFSVFGRGAGAKTKVQ